MYSKQTWVFGDCADEGCGRAIRRNSQSTVCLLFGKEMIIFMRILAYTGQASRGMLVVTQSRMRVGEYRGLDPGVLNGCVHEVMKLLSYFISDLCPHQSLRHGSVQGMNFLAGKEWKGCALSVWPEVST